MAKMRPEETPNDPHGRKSVNAEDFDNLYKEYQSVLKQKEALGEQIELASQSSADLQSHIDQSQEEFKMYEDDIKSLKEQNKVIMGKYRKLKAAHEELKSSLKKNQGKIYQQMMNIFKYFHKIRMKFLDFKFDSPLIREMDQIENSDIILTDEDKIKFDVSF